LTIEIAKHHHRSVDQAWYESALAIAKERSRGVANFRNTIDWSKYLAWVSETVFVWYDDLSLTEFEIIKDFDADGQRVIVLDRTVFYPEMWWQRGDSGSMNFASWEQVTVIDTIKFAGVILHMVE
jgi:alanyl-tRNA synthetase